jgi:hypothetical protein
MRVTVTDRSLTPAEAVLWVTADGAGEGAEVRGRLHGPRCLYASTVALAYPLRPTRPADAAPPATARAVIPEPNWWDPRSPFWYEVTAELWSGGRVVAGTNRIHGLRAVRPTPAALVWNGAPLPLRGTEFAGEDEGRCDVELLRRRDAGYNLVVVPVSGPTAAVWSAADRVGLLVLGRTDDDESAAAAEGLAGHACALGWLSRSGRWPRPSRRQLRGLELTGPPAAPPADADFVAGPADLLNGLPSPKLVFGPGTAGGAWGAVE